MQVRIVCVGKLKEKYWKEAEAEYAKMLSRYCDLKIIEVKDETQRPDDIARELEAQRILPQIKGFVTACDLKGEMLSSEQFSEFLEELAVMGQSCITFVIGGSTGLSEKVTENASRRLCFSKMTIPHRLFRILLLEQIYRAYKIARGETYHK